MSKKDFMTSVKSLCEEVISDLDYELVDVEYLKESGDFYLRVYIHKPGGVNLDDCQIVSEKLSNRLDEEDIIQKAYYLEVSSPGLDRPLKTDKDLERNLENEVEVSLYKAMDGVKKYEGILKSYDGDSVELKTVDKMVKIPRKSVSLIRLTIKF
ncbi:ribosome maturation factor RimP [Gudongella sp. DL1XJH-153]|uniref:ribosome maturation factor RimP n=1 Tax=Gudongella sp. DL1XJH-153 TaxID=3409804 RepID=UPI003BB671E4